MCNQLKSIKIYFVLSCLFIVNYIISIYNDIFHPIKPIDKSNIDPNELVMLLDEEEQTTHQPIIFSPEKPEKKE